MQYGVAEHFTKPFNPIDLQEAVNKISKYQETKLTAQAG
jgi:YesN/AraC family two-component response regulator